MPLTLILSGPKVSAQQARTALTAARFDVQATDDNCGLADDVCGDEVRQAVAFVTVLGESVDEAAQAVASLGWLLRMHFDTPEPSAPSVEQQLADKLAEYEQRIAELEARA